jgi:hypothetical protein
MSNVMAPVNPERKSSLNLRVSPVVQRSHGASTLATGPGFGHRTQPLRSLTCRTVRFTPYRRTPGGSRVGVGQASAFGRDRYVGNRGAVVGMHTFSASAPIKELPTRFGFTAASVTHAARRTLASTKGEQ